ncbi:MAG TPA: adenylate/guanylate cyclase domain-containing protein [Acidimicrobiales bacterium]|nr:adenylate/guanylate cyclase domain-containing protein [Acidimicrobiales bacterium]
MEERAGGDAIIDVFLADDNVIVREGVRALLELQPDLRVVGVAGDYDELVEGAVRTGAHVLVTDIRMPPSFQREGIDAAREVRRRLPGTAVVVLSQYDDPEYAVSLLSEGSSGYGYLLKDHIADGDQLVEAVRAVATGGTALDPAIVDALVRPVSHGGLSEADEELLSMIAEGRPIKAIAAAQRATPESVDARVEALFVALAEGVAGGNEGALRRLRLLHQAIVDREEQGETLSRLLPGGLAEKLRREGRHIGETEVVEVTVLMSDIRSYSTIAEHADLTQLAGQLNTHRAAMNEAILGQTGTVMQFVGDAVMAVFGAPFAQPDHADRAVAAAADAHRRQAEVNAAWAAEGLPPFGLGLGLSTGPAAAALLGSEERLEYTLVGDTVNLAQRLQQLAEAGETVLSAATMAALDQPVVATELGEQLVKGRDTPVGVYKIGRASPGDDAGRGLAAAAAGGEG